MLRHLARTAALLCLALAGCHSTLNLNDLSLEATKLAKTPAGLVLTLAYTNNNSTQLVVTEAEHSLFFDGALLGKFETTKPAGLPMFAKVTQELIVPEPLAGKILALYAERQAAVAYRIQSKLAVTIRAEEDTVRASGGGSLSLVQ
jgi:LEA14-like dessication related protein